MNIGNKHKSPADALAAILGSDGSARAQDDEFDENASDAADPGSDDLGTDGAEESLEVVDDLGENDGDEVGAEPEAEVPIAPSRRRRERTAAKTAPAGGRMLRMFGLLCLCGGVLAT